jgi:SAM-dependent methyltransferase
MIAMTCLVCQSTQSRRLYIQNGYQVFRCAGCGFQFVAPTPTPEELARYYDQSYAVPLERYAGYSARHEDRIVELERWRPSRGQLLEVGASYGHSLAIARGRGWQSIGVELSPTAARYAREQFGLDVHNCDLLDAPFEDQSFDAAILWHVLEHTHDPQAQLDRLWSLLRPGGVLGLRVPNVTSFGARLAGRSWPWMCPPAHLWYFSPSTLPRLLAKCNFEVLEVKTLRGDGNNIYQHALIALGARLNALRRRIGARSRSTSAGLANAPAPSGPIASEAPSPNPLALQSAWLGLLARAQPATDALARMSRGLIDPIEATGGGDELLCYARRPCI